MWRFCCGGGGRSRKARGYIPQAQYDMEMSQTSTANGGHNGNSVGGGSFRDDADLDDEEEYDGKFADPPASVVRV